jgi:hypothetical protein
MTRVRRPCTLGAWLVPKREIFTIRCSNASHYYNLLHLHVLRRGRLLIGSGVVAGTERKLQLWTVFALRRTARPGSFWTRSADWATIPSTVRSDTSR